MTSSSIVVGGDDDHSENISSSCSRGPTTSTEFCGSTEEEEDMANCLILLAQGGSPNHPNFQIGEAAAVGKLSSRKLFTEAATAMKPGGFYAYECKTCNRCFPSFQALGGHRASHKKPKTSEEKKALEEENSQMASSSTSPTKAIPYNKSRVHECSICGSEFSSGQALGGHMRRHRTATIDSQENIRKERNVNVMSLDLNLPAPEEDLEFAGGFTFSAKQLPLVFAGSSLVDCPY